MIGWILICAALVVVAFLLTTPVSGPGLEPWQVVGTVVIAVAMVFCLWMGTGHARFQTCISMALVVVFAPPFIALAVGNKWLLGAFLLDIAQNGVRWIWTMYVWGFELIILQAIRPFPVLLENP